MDKVLLTSGFLCDKWKAHMEGLEHYALSLMIFNSQGELLLQKRAEDKYHSGNLWTNTCCTHPLFKNVEQIRQTAGVRLKYEMGISCELEYLYSFSYQIDCGQMIENELDHVFIGYSDCDPVVNPREVCDFKWLNLRNVNHDRSRFPHNYTPWFHILLDQWDLKEKEIKLKLGIS